MNRFLKDEKDNWRRLEDLLDMMRGSGLRGLSRMEVREFGELYRRAAADLAIARAETRDPKLVNYLNSLVIRAHGKIYRAENQGLELIVNFFARDFPRTFRENWRYMALAFGVFALFAAIGFAATWRNVEFTHFVSLEGAVDAINANEEWWRDLNRANQVGATEILTNNIIVTIRAFAMGALFGVGAAYDLAFEGARLGSIFAACYKLNPPFGNSLASFVVGHGVIELSCIFFCGGSGMMIGYTIINPGDLTRAEALKIREWRRQRSLQAARSCLSSPVPSKDFCHRQTCRQLSNSEPASVPVLRCIAICFWRAEHQNTCPDY